MAGGTVSISGQRTEIPHALVFKRKKKPKNKNQKTKQTYVIRGTLD